MQKKYSLNMFWKVSHKTKMTFCNHYLWTSTLKLCSFYILKVEVKNFKPLEWVKEVPKFHCPQMKSSKTTIWETKPHSIQNVPAPKTPTLEPTTREKRIWVFPLFENFFPSSNNTSKGKEYIVQQCQVRKNEFLPPSQLCTLFQLSIFKKGLRRTCNRWF